MDHRSDNSVNDPYRWAVWLAFPVFAILLVPYGWMAYMAYRFITYLLIDFDGSPLTMYSLLVFAVGGILCLLYIGMVPIQLYRDSQEIKKHAAASQRREPDQTFLRAFPPSQKDSETDA